MLENRPPTSRLLDVIGDSVDCAIINALADGVCTVKGLETSLTSGGSAAICEHRKRLTQLGIIEEEMRPGTARTKEVRLTRDLGRAMLDLAHFADRCLTKWSADLDWSEPAGHELVTDAIREGWRYEILQRTAFRPRTVAGIERDAKRFTHGELRARMQKLHRAGLMELHGDTNRGPLFAPTDRCRRLIGLLARVARMERDHLPDPTIEISPGLIVSGVLFALPVVELPGDASGAVELTVKQRTARSGDGPALAWASLVVRNGRVVWRLPGPFRGAIQRMRGETDDRSPAWPEVERQDLSFDSPTSWLMAGPEDVLNALLDDNPKAILPDGKDDGELVEMIRTDFVRQLDPG